jgi:proton-dependent oligopeptide transporter, POT family
MSSRQEREEVDLSRLLIPSGRASTSSGHSAPSPQSSFGSSYQPHESTPLQPLVSLLFNSQRSASPTMQSATPPPPPSYPPPSLQNSGMSTPTKSPSAPKKFRVAMSPASSRPGSRPGSRQSSRAPSPTFSESSDDLPNNVCREDQLALLPSECLSGDSVRPLRHVDESGEESFYALQPMRYSVIFILLVELFERFSFYGLNYTQTSYLTGVYDPKWNAGMAAVTASSFVSISVAVAYTTPFLGAVLADSLLGDYWSILVGALVFYIPGLFLIAFTTIPGLLGKDFNIAALGVGLLFLWPTGTGIVKSIVNIFG